MKVISIVGARPQFIKLAPLSRKLRENFEEKIIHTGQHFDEEMSDKFFKQLEIPEPDYNLGIGGGKHGDQTGRMLIAIEDILIKENPNLVVVFGDTNTTLAGALAAVKLHMKCVHLEAGLRSFNRSMPEEINRIVADHISDYLFAPTQTAVGNLKNEDLEKKSFLTGDIMVDSLKDNIEKARKYSQIIKVLSLIPDHYYLLTLHRPYNVDSPEKLKRLFRKLEYTDGQFVFPAHPRTRQVIEYNNLLVPKNIKIIKPLGYLDFIMLEANAKKIITDSGGIQKEAYILGKSCLTLRPETEWVETIKDGCNILISIDEEDFSQKIINFNSSLSQTNVFGQSVAEKMSNIVFEILMV